jgi:hypothetical protein
MQRHMRRTMAAAGTARVKAQDLLLQQLLQVLL